MNKRLYNLGEIWDISSDPEGTTLRVLVSIDNPDVSFIIELVEDRALMGDEETMKAFLAYQSMFHFVVKDGYITMTVSRGGYNDADLKKIRKLAKCGEGQFIWSAPSVRIEDRGDLVAFTAVAWKDLGLRIVDPITDGEKERLSEALYQKAKTLALAEVERRFDRSRS